MEVDRSTSVKLASSEAVLEAVQGAILGSLAVMTLTPVLYAKNMMQLKKPFIFSHCIRGIVLNGINVVPATTVAFAVNSLFCRALFHKEREKLSLSEQALASSTAGALAGIAITPGELIVQNYQSGWENSLSRVTKRVLRERGVFTLFRGAGAIALRDGIYVSSYFVGARGISQLIDTKLHNEALSEALGGVAAGSITGLAITIPDALRAHRQDMTKNWTYSQTIKSVGVGSLMKSVAPVTSYVILSTLLIIRAQKLFFKD